jgi:hypothetical protein
MSSVSSVSTSAGGSRLRSGSAADVDMIMLAEQDDDVAHHLLGDSTAMAEEELEMRLAHHHHHHATTGQLTKAAAVVAAGTLGIQRHKLGRRTSSLQGMVPTMAALASQHSSSTNSLQGLLSNQHSSSSSSSSVKQHPPPQPQTVLQHNPIAYPTAVHQPQPGLVKGAQYTFVTHVDAQQPMMAAAAANKKASSRLPSFGGSGAGGEGHGGGAGGWMSKLWGMAAGAVRA